MLTKICKSCQMSRSSLKTMNPLSYISMKTKQVWKRRDSRATTTTTLLTLEEFSKLHQIQTCSTIETCPTSSILWKAKERTMMWRQLLVHSPMAQPCKCTTAKGRHQGKRCQCLLKSPAWVRSNRKRQTRSKCQLSRLKLLNSRQMADLIKLNRLRVGKKPKRLPFRR